MHHLIHSHTECCPYLYNADLVTTVFPHICYLKKVMRGYAICGGMRTCHSSSELERAAATASALLLFIPRAQNKSLSPPLPTLSKKVVGGFKREKSVGKLTRAAVHTTTRPHLAEATS